MTDAPPRFVLFDIGGVLCDVDLDRGRARCAALGFDDAVFDAVQASGAKPDGDRGTLDAPGMVATVRAYCGAAADDLTEAALRDFWGAIVSWRGYVDRLLARLTVPYGVLSVIDPIHAAALGPLPGADPIVYSCDVGALKPEPAAYAAVLERCDVAPGDILFVDDREPNVAAARRMGLKSRCVHDLPTLETALGNLLEPLERH